MKFTAYMTRPAVKRAGVAATTDGGAASSSTAYPARTARAKLLTVATRPGEQSGSCRITSRLIASGTIQITRAGRSPMTARAKCAKTVLASKYVGSGAAAD